MEHGEPSAAEALLDHRGFVRALARSLVTGGDRVDDLAQDALVAGLAQPARCERAWRSWLRSTVRRLAWNRQRTQRRSDLRERAAAQREALPSTAALVMRLELEQRVVAAVLTLPASERTVVLLRFYDGQETAAIAANLGLPADTVRARLRRALARLREQLDRSCGDREGWQRGLAALSIGGAVMGSKLMLATVAAGVVAAATWFALPERLGGFRSEPVDLASRGSAGVASDLPPELATPALGEVAEPARVELRDDGGADAGVPAAAALPPPGQVAFHVIDAETRAPIDEVAIRFLNETRYALFEGGGAGEAALTAGRWSARITAPGHEPAEVATLEVAVGQVTELGTVELVRGGGRIEGRVTARGVADRTLTVELRGAGRSPCAACRAKAAATNVVATSEVREVPDRFPDPTVRDDCGFGNDVSRLPLAEGETFRFTDLAAGTYWLRAFDATTQLVDSRRVDVARNGHEWVDLDLSLPTTLVVELRHESGHSFTGVWGHPYGEDPAPIEFAVTVGEKARGGAHATPTVADVRSTMGPPSTFGEMVQDDGAKPAAKPVITEQLELELRTLEAEQLAIHAAIALDSIETVRVANDRDRIDRERQPPDALVPEPAAPDLAEVALAAERLRPDSFRLGPLPRERVKLKVSSDVYASATLDVDLRFGFTGPLLVTLHPLFRGDPDDPSSDGVAFSKTCMSCHDSAATAQRRFAAQAQAMDELELVRSRIDALSAESAYREVR